MKPNIFIVAPYTIFPTVAANHKDIWGHVEIFASLGYQVHLIYYGDAAEKPKLTAAQKRLDLKIHILPISAATIENTYTYWYQANIHFGEQSLEKFNALIKGYSPKIIFFEYGRFAYLAETLNTGKAQIFFRSHNFELMHDVEKDFFNAKEQKKTTWQVIKESRAKWWSIYCNERLMFRVADRVFSISAGDNSAFKKWYQTTNFSLLPAYIPDIPSDYKPHKRSRLKVLYMGSNFSNNVNFAGAEYLVKQVVPLVKQTEFEFHIIGKGSQDLAKALGKPKNVIYHGFIDDLWDFLKDMDISCLPVKIGRGTKIKAFESMALGLPTVGFPETFYGFADKSLGLTAKSAAGIAQQLKNLRDFGYRSLISQHAKEGLARMNDLQALRAEIVKYIKN